MNIKKTFIALLIMFSLVACTSNEQKKSQLRNDSIRKADSLALVYEQQRVIDSINTVTREQQIIADSIHNLVSN